MISLTVKSLQNFSHTEESNFLIHMAEENVKLVRECCQHLLIEIARMQVMSKHGSNTSKVIILIKRKLHI